MKPKVFVTRVFPGEGLGTLTKDENLITEIWPEDRSITKNEFLQSVPGVDGIISTAYDIVDEEVMDAAGNLKVISNWGVGYNNIDIQAATKRGIMVTNTPDVLTDAVAELTLFLMLAVARKANEAQRYLYGGQWKESRTDLLLGIELGGAVLGLVGFGRIGQEVAKRVSGFNMELLYHDVNPNREAEEKYGAGYVSFEELLSRSDFISLHVPLTEKTRGLIGERELNLMKRSAILINTSRGPVVQEMELYKSLKDGKIAGAGLDVFEVEPISMDNPLLELDNVFLMPHVGSGTDKSRNLMSIIAVRNMVEALSGQRPTNLVNPETWKS